MHKLYFLLLLFSVSLKAQFIQVNRTYTAEQLVKDIFLGSNCIEVDDRSIEITGFNNSDFISYGYFAKGTSNFPMENGILLSTGNINGAVGPNNSLQSFTNSNWEGDRDLEEALDLRSNSTFDATILEFDFISQQDSQINFDYIFASEQYLRNANEGRCGYTDGFAFLIKEVDSRDDYINIALIPNTTIPVSVNTIFGVGGLCPPINPQYFRQFNQGNSATNFNGETVVLTATANVIPGKKYHLKLVIADQGNGLYDSGVFLRAGSFSGVKDLGEDLLIANGNALCFGEETTLDATTSNATAYQWYVNGIMIPGANSSTYTVTSAGTYKVEITLSSGCTISGDRRIEYLNEISIATNQFEVCDDDLDGIITIRLSDYQNQIISTLDPSTTITFHATSMDAENGINPITSFTLSQLDNSKIVYIRLISGGCSPVVFPITFSRNQPTPYTPILPIEICDTRGDGVETINLGDYMDLLNVDFESFPAFFMTQEDARLNRNAIAVNQSITISTTFYVRFKGENQCVNIAPLSFLFKPIPFSDTLTDQTICSGSTTSIDAGNGYDSYLWLHNNSTAQRLENVSAGTYTVRLELNGCFIEQSVTISESADLIISSILIQGTTITISVDGDNPPYLYALDNDSFQTSNVFTNVSLGPHVVYVRPLQADCNIVSKEFSIINIVNTITPNGDGINDRLDLSHLYLKENPSFIIYDRFGMIVFEGTPANQYIWDGKKNGKPLKTDSYWYDIQWTEPHTENTQRYTSWILLKNK